MDQVVSQTTYPKLVAVGENPMKLDSVLLCVEGQGEDVTWYPMDTIFLPCMLVITFFPLCIHKSLKIFFFIDSVLMGLHHTVKNRISLQKFVRDIKSLM